MGFVTPAIQTPLVLESLQPAAIGYIFMQIWISARGTPSYNPETECADRNLDAKSTPSADSRKRQPSKQKVHRFIQNPSSHRKPPATCAWTRLCSQATAHRDPYLPLKKHGCRTATVHKAVAIDPCSRNPVGVCRSIGSPGHGCCSARIVRHVAFGVSLSEIVDLWD